MAFFLHIIMIDLDTILSQLINLFQTNQNTFKQNQSVSTKSESNNITKTPIDTQYQNPLKVTYYNSGDFGKGDARHKGVHNGVDLRAPGGTPTYSITNGVVDSVSSQPKGGNVISISHGNNLKTVYRHMGTVNVKPGQEVDKSTVIGTVGDSGNAIGTAPHIHFEVKENGTYVDPKKYIYVPPYSNLQPGEVSWVSQEHKQNARNFKVNEHLSRVASKADKIEKIANLYYLISLK